MRHIIRYARPEREGMPWLWHYVRISDPGGDIPVTSIAEFYKASYHGTPFGGSSGTHALDQYYMRRFPWRQWQADSVRCAAKRVWNRKCTT